MTLMNDLVQRIFNAIIKQEGMPADWTNPGNCRDCPWFLAVAGMPRAARLYPDGTLVTFANGFWIPRTRGEGIAGGSHVVNLRIAEGQSLVELITAWAPPGDSNNTAAYIAHVKKWARIPNKNVPLWNFIETVPKA